MDPHNYLAPDPYLNEKPDPDPPPHQSEKPDPDLHQSDANGKMCKFCSVYLRYYMVHI
jgi:hypothetical protein